MENNFFRRIPTDLDLNGPVLEYTTQPSDASGDKDGSVTFTVAAQALFPGDSGAEDGGTITFQWYEVGVGALSNGGQLSGVTTATLTLSDLRTPQDQGRTFYCEISYLQNNEYDSADSGTGTAINQPLKSDEASVSVNPELEIIAQPSDRTVGENIAATFTVNAGLTDNTYLSDGAVVYQWYVGLGNATPTLVTDGTVQTTNITSEVVTVEEEGIAFDTETFTESKSFGTGQHNVNIPPTGYDVSFTVAAAGGGRGGSDAGGGPGSGGNGRVGTFTMPTPQAQGRQLNFWCGNKGGDGGNGSGGGTRGGPGQSVAGHGGRGGGAGPRGWSGGGGGGGGASAVLRDGGDKIVVVGGGGGGGGGSHNSGTAPGGGSGLGLGGRPFTNNELNNVSVGGNGGDCPDDGGGGGGGGGGHRPQRGGGGAGRDRTSTGRGGEGGRSGYRSDIVNFVPPGGNNGGNGYASIDFKYTVTTSRPITTTREETVYTTFTQNTTISGQGTNTLTITSDESTFNAVRKVYVVVSHVTATNSPVTSDTVTSTVVDTTGANNIIIETIAANKTVQSSTINLSNGDKEIDAGATDNENGSGAYLYSMYSPDKDMLVEMDLYGGIGRNENDLVFGFSGGEGGFSRIRFTMERNVEYVLAGMTDSVQTPYLYRKANLIACVGGGGEAGRQGRGGFGGGVNVAGEDAPGRYGGNGGVKIPTGTLTAPGIFGSETTLTATSPDTKAIRPIGGRTLPCTRGTYWRDQGKSPCEDLGTIKFRWSDGTELTDTASIDRGYKAGYNIIQTKGERGRPSVTNLHSGVGGSGATGGDGGDNNFGGGGGSGYSDGSVTIVSTQLGGSTFFDAKVILRVVT